MEPGQHEQDAPPPGHGDPAAWPLGRLLSTAARIVERQWDEQLRAVGLTHAAVVVLQHLAVGGDASPDALARLVRVQPQTMSRTLDRMERDGLVERRASSEDRRRRIVRVTDQGVRAWQGVQRLELAVLADDDGAMRAALLRIVDPR